jgi:hypothetical protein
MKKLPVTFIVRRALGKWPVFCRFGIARQFWPSAGFWETGLPCERPGRGRNKAFRNPAPCTAVIPGWRASPGLCSSRAVEVSWPWFLATSHSCFAIYSPAGRSNSLKVLLLMAAVAVRREIAMSLTQTQLTRRFNGFALVFHKGAIRELSAMNQMANLTGQSSRAHVPKAPDRRLSEVVNHIPQSKTQCLGDFQQRINGDGPVRAFNLADVNRVQIGLFRQFFLTPTRLLSLDANVFADQLAVFWNGCHKPLRTEGSPKRP